MDLTWWYYKSLPNLIPHPLFWIHLYRYIASFLVSKHISSSQDNNTGIKMVWVSVFDV